MTNDMRVIVERSALSVTSGCSVSESYFKTKGSDGIQIEWRVFSSFFLALWDGGWWSGFDCVLSHCSSLTDIWKVPLGKYSGLPGADYRVSWLETPAGCSIKELHMPATAYAACSSHGGNVYVYVLMDVLAMLGECGRYIWHQDKAVNQRSSARSTSVQVMSEEKGAGFFF